MNEFLVDTIICINLKCMIQRAKIKEFIWLYSIHDLTNRKCKKKNPTRISKQIQQSCRIKAQYTKINYIYTCEQWSILIN